MCSTIAKTKVREGGTHQKGLCIASNHFSNYDPPFFHAAQKPINFIAASDQKLVVVNLGPFLYGKDSVDRTKLASTIKRSLDVLKEILGIFPDGGVNDTILGNPKNGTVYLSTVGKAPIVPVYLELKQQ